MKLGRPWLKQARTIHRVVQVDLRQVLLHTLLLGLAFSALLAIPLWLHHRVESERRLDRLRASQEQVVKLARDAIRHEMDAILSDLRYLAQHNELRNFLADDHGEHRLALAREYLVLVGQKRLYDQVRFIGLDGRERVRVDFNDGRPAIADDRQLQDKRDRYYFEETLWLLPGQIFVSPFDLNVEHGQVEAPAKPVIRFTIPVADDQGIIRGMVVLNYLGQRLLEALHALEGEAGRLWLISAEGDWLIGPTPADEWAFMFPQRLPRRVADLDPALWQRMVDEPSGVHRSSSSEIRFERIHPLRGTAAVAGGGALAQPVDAERYHWTLAVALPQPALPAANVADQRRLLAVYGTLALFAFLAAAALAFILGRNRALAQVTEQVLDSLPLLVAYVDAGERYRFNNMAYERFFGTSPRQIYGKSLRELLGDSAYDDLRPYVDAVLAGKTVSFERRLAYRGAGMRDVVVTYLPDVSPRGEVRGFYGIVSDVTLLKESERRERQHMLELAHVSRLASMGEMATEIAHEINQPLAAIAMFSAAGLRTVGDPEQAGQLRSWLEAINAQGKRASEVVRQVRSFVRKGTPQFGPVDLNQVAREVLALIDHDARAHQVAITLQAADPLPPARGERILLEQVAFNLVRNALDAVMARQDGRRISVTTSYDAAQVSFAIADNGPGVDPELDARIYDSFVTSKKEGLGMGLAISRNIIEAHAGTLRHEPNPGGGSVFVFSVPREAT